MRSQHGVIKRPSAVINFVRLLPCLGTYDITNGKDKPEDQWSSSSPETLVLSTD